MPPADFRKALRYQVQDVLPISGRRRQPRLPPARRARGADAEDGSTRRVARVLLVAAAREMVDSFVARGRRCRPATRRASTCCRSRWSAAPTSAPSSVDGSGDRRGHRRHRRRRRDLWSCIAGGQPRYVRMIARPRRRLDHRRRSSSATTGPGTTPSAPRSCVGLAGHSTLKPQSRSRGRPGPPGPAASWPPGRRAGRRDRHDPGLRAWRGSARSCAGAAGRRGQPARRSAAASGDPAGHPGGADDAD